eukprot:6184437-Pleurochrysis_carterae.AAC.2
MVGSLRCAQTLEAVVQVLVRARARYRLATTIAKDLGNVNACTLVVNGCLETWNRNCQKELAGRRNISLCLDEDGGAARATCGPNRA